MFNLLTTNVPISFLKLGTKTKVDFFFFAQYLSPHGGTFPVEQHTIFHHISYNKEEAIEAPSLTSDLFSYCGAG